MPLYIQLNRELSVAPKMALDQGCLLRFAINFGLS